MRVQTMAAIALAVLRLVTPASAEDSSKYAPERVHALLLGGAHPYADHSWDAFKHVDGRDPEAFVAALEAVVAQQIPQELKPRVLANDLQALAAAAQDRLALEDVLPTMTMPCLLLVGDAAARYPAVRQCVTHIAHASFATLPAVIMLPALYAATSCFLKSRVFWRPGGREAQRKAGSVVCAGSWAEPNKLLPLTPALPPCGRSVRRRSTPALGVMSQSPLLEFESSAFAVTPGEDEETNPGVYGKALARWLVEQLRAAGFSVGDVTAEDFGWCVPVASEPHALYVACASTGKRPDQWRVFAFAEGGVMARLLGKDKRAESLAALYTAVRRCLESAPTILNLREEA